MSYHYSFVGSMAEDLGKHFYEYFPQFLSTLIELLNSKDAEQVEWTFYCLARLFKILKRFLKNDLSIVYNAILPLLNRRRYPEYVNNYASECFAYIARDIHDKDKFLAMLLHGVKNHHDGKINCGRLLYELVRGPSQGLHSCAEGFFANWMKSLINPSIDKDVLFDLLSQFTNHLVQNTNPHKLDPFWKVSFDVLTELSDAAPTNDTAIRMILILLEQAIKYRNGKSLCRLNEVIEKLIALSDRDISTETMLQVSQIMAMILLSPNLTITQLDSSRMCKKILSTSQKNVLEHFVWALVNWSQFEILILPEFLKYFERHFECELSSFELMTKIILEKSPLCQDGISLEHWKTYPITFKCEETLSRIEKIVSGVEQSEKYVMSLIVYPHVTGKDGSVTGKNLEDKLQRLLKEIQGAQPPLDLNSLKNTFYLLSIVIETIIHLDQAGTMDINEITNRLLPYCTDDKFTPTLQILDQILSIQPEEKLNFTLFQTIHCKLASNLSSESHDVRLLTAHILRHFSKLQELQQPKESIYEIFYNCENVVSNVQTYRDQLMNLQKLSTSMDLFRGIKGTVCRLDPLR